MKEKNIDEIFRKTFEGDSQTILPEDWMRFEANIPTKKGGWKSKSLYLLLLLLFPASFLIYYLGSGPAPAHESRKLTHVQQSEIFTPSSDEAMSTDSIISAERKIRHESDQAKSALQNKKEDSSGNIEFEQSESSTHQGKNIELRIAPRDQNQKVYASNDQKEIDGVEGYSKPGKSEEKAEEIAKSANGRIEDISLMNGFERDFQDEPQISLAFDFQKMESIEATHFSQIIPAFADDLRNVNFTTTPTWRPFIYIKVESSSNLRTAGGIGVGAVRSLNKNFGLRSSIGILRAGNLSLKQNRSQISYGFDQITEKYELTTRSLDLIQVPLFVEYRFKGLHRLYLGVENNFMLSANQELSVGDGDDQLLLTEEGFLYKAPAPNWTYAFSGGYAFRFDEYFDLEIGGFFSPQKWEISNTANSGFSVKLNYHIK